MKKKINIFSNKKINVFFNNLFIDHELFFMELKEIKNEINNNNPNIIILDNDNEAKLINFENLTEKFIILSAQKNIKFKTNCTLIKIPTSTNLIKNTIENFIQSLKIQFHDISINNERLTNIKNDSFCYLTKLESEILSHLILEKESTKNYIKENILQIKSTIQTNSLDSHLTRIRKKMNKINTSVKIQSKSEKLLICT